MRMFACAAIALSLATGPVFARDLTPGEKSWVASISACLQEAGVPKGQTPPACAFPRDEKGQLRLHCLDGHKQAGNKCLAGNGPKPPEKSIAY